MRRSRSTHPTLRARAGAVLVVAIAVVAACKFSPQEIISSTDDAPLGLDDAPILEDAYVPDAGGCQIADEKTCVGPTLRTCSTVGTIPTDTPCAWGCSVGGSAAHCAKLQPSGGAVTETDLEPTAGLDDKQIGVISIDLNTDDGSISGVRSAGSGVKNGIDFQVRGTVGVFRFQKLTLDGLGLGRLNVRGSNALAIVAIESITVNARIGVQDCNATNPGAGGFAGGARGSNGSGAGGGTAGSGSPKMASGGAGGGHGASGGNGGSGKNQSATTGGAPTGDLQISVLVGGAGGGGGGGPSGAIGGGGGGAIQLASNGTIRIVGGINAGGCGGQGTAAGSDGAGGGGAGGAILIEAPMIELAAGTYIVVNGGGGGGGDVDQNNSGEDGVSSSNRANGGTSGDKGGDGGQGAASTTFVGGNGQGDDVGGGGAGAVGRIRLNSYTGAAAISNQATVSPRLGASGSTATQGTANVQ